VSEQQRSAAEARWSKAGARQAASAAARERWIRRKSEDPAAGRRRTLRARHLRRLRGNEVSILRRLLTLAGLKRGVYVAGFRADYAGELGGKRPPLVVGNDWTREADEWNRRKTAWEQSGYKVIGFSELAE
jgi:hypothetical protein